jgi:hypothetical protein
MSDDEVLNKGTFLQCIFHQYLFRTHNKKCEKCEQQLVLKLADKVVYGSVQEMGVGSTGLCSYYFNIYNLFLQNIFYIRLLSSSYTENNFACKF